MIGTQPNTALGSTDHSYRLTGSSRVTLASITRPLRALLRVPGKPFLALGVILATGFSLATTNIAGTNAALFRTSVQPLAPAPAPPPPPFLSAQSKHFAAGLGRFNPLRGLASWYGNVWNGRKTASGETFDETKLTAAHNTLPLGTLVRVTNLQSMRSVIVKINDRGALAPHRIIDLSSAAARQIGILDNGLARVELEVLGRL